MESSSATIAFLEMEGWEDPYIREHLPSHDLLFSPAALTDDNFAEFAEASILSTFIRSSVTTRIIASLPRLRLIATRSTGFDHIELAACRERGIAVANVPYYGENTVAEHTFGLMLALSRQIHKAWRRTSAGDFSNEGLRGFDLKGKTLGVVGAGNIGLHVIRIGRGFGMRVLAYDVRPNHLVAEVLGFEYAALEDILRASDVISLHTPYTAQTHHLINQDNIRTVKPGAILINTARGGVVDTEALLWGLDNGVLAGAGLDVLEGEEFVTEDSRLLATGSPEEALRLHMRQHQLLRRDNVLITPHNAFNSQEALQRILDTTIDNILSFLDGKPKNLVSGLQA